MGVSGESLSDRQGSRGFPATDDRVVPGGSRGPRGCLGGSFSGVCWDLLSSLKMLSNVASHNES